MYIGIKVIGNQSCPSYLTYAQVIGVNLSLCIAC